MKMTAKLRNFH